jgi:hypothetical protein
MGKYALFAGALLVSCLLALPLVCVASVSVTHIFEGESHPGGLMYPGGDLGDFNGDGYADWAVYTDERSVNVYFGSASPDTIPDLVLREHDFSISDYSRLAGACDFNGDGYGDVVFLTYKRVYVYLGGATPDAQLDLELAWNPEESHAFLAAAGDFNGDTYGDVVVADDSTTYVFLGGDLPDGEPDLTIAKGGQVAGLGDVNDDGFDDLAIGTAPTNVYLGGDPPDSTADLAIPTTLLVWGGYPHVLAGAGDMNGDGYDDLAVGNPDYDNPATAGSSDGKVDLYYGGSPMDAAADWTVVGTVSGGDLGEAVRSAGDANDDGFHDLLVGYDNKDYLFFGGATPDTLLDLTLVGPTGEDNWGGIAVGLGDVNGDDIDDVLGGPGYYGNYARLYWGGAAMDSIADLVVTDEIGHELGYAVSEAGDLNADTYPDWAIGLPKQPQINRGSAYVYYGGASDDMTRDVMMVGPGDFGGQMDQAGDVRNDGYDDLLVRCDMCGDYVYVYYGGAPMDSVQDKKLSTQPNGSDNWTASTSEAGDFNGNGYDDVMVGYAGMFMPYWTELYYGGATFNTKPDVYFTGSEPAGGGNVNGDAFGDVVIGEPYTWSGNGVVRVYLGGAAVDTFPDPGYVFEGPCESFGSRVTFAGDVNGDGFDDILASCSREEYYNGDVYLYFGGPAMDTIPDLTLASPGTGSGFGAALEALGDINGDIFDDFAVGAPWGAGYKGQVLIYLGGNPMDADPDIVLEGENPEDRFGFSIAGAGDINGDGDLEFLVGAPGYADNRGRAYMYAAVGAGVIPVRSDLAYLAIRDVGPNPITDQITVWYSTGQIGTVRAELYDVSGRMVRTLARQAAAPGDNVLTVGLATQGERAVAPGVYFIRLSQGGRSQARKVVIAE